MQLMTLLRQPDGTEQECEESLLLAADVDSPLSPSGISGGERFSMYQRMNRNRFRKAFGPRLALRWKYSSLSASCRRLFKGVVWAVACFVLFSLLNGILHPSYATTPEAYRPLEHDVLKYINPGRGNARQEKVFIASNIIDEKLIRGPWGLAVRELVDLLGPSNVFVSIYENDSGEGTRDALRDLQKKLPCNSSIVTGGHLSLDAFPKVLLPNGEARVQRLTYLAEVRNRLLRPLDPAFIANQTLEPGFQSAADRHFDKVLFLNDVYFSPLEALHLLFSTNMDSNGVAQYRAVCAADFVRGVMFYDSFVVRDTDGYGLGLMFYPWFAPIGSGTSRKDVKAGKDAVRVRSCWGGMVAFDAAVFRRIPASRTIDTSSAVLPAADKPDNALALKFRGSNETFWEEAECCLLFADMEELHGTPNPQTGTGVFINPFIRVAYDKMTWKWIPFYRRFEHVFEFLQWTVSLIGYPEYNPRRTHEPGMMVDEIVWAATSSSSDTLTVPGAPMGNFQYVHREARPGGFCGQRRLFVMKEDLQKSNRGATGKNWENVQVPRRLRQVSSVKNPETLV